MLCQETSLSKSKKTVVIQIIFSDHKSIKQEINKRKTRIFANTWNLNNTLQQPRH